MEGVSNSDNIFTVCGFIIGYCLMRLITCFRSSSCIKKANLCLTNVFFNFCCYSLNLLKLMLVYF